MSEASPPIPTPVDGNPIKRLALGFSYPLRGMRVVAKDKPLLLMSLAPVTITILLYGAGLFYLLGHITDIVNLIWAFPEGEDWVATALQVLWYLLYPIVVVLSLAVVYFTIIVVANLVTIPFIDFISERVESLARGRDASVPFSFSRFFEDLVRGVVHTLRRLLALVIVLAPITLLGLFLAPAAAVLAALVMTYFLALEYLDPPMNRYQWDFQRKKGMVVENRALCLGFGGAVYLILLLPPLAIFCIPACVAGATLMFVGLNPELPPHTRRGEAQEEPA